MHTILSAEQLVGAALVLSAVVVVQVRPRSAQGA